ncbi:hypothetical protein ABVT39_017221 [Epinephelus coioides]
MADKRERERKNRHSTAQTSRVSPEVVAEFHSYAAAAGAHHAASESAVGRIPLPVSTDSTPESKRTKTDPMEPSLAEMQENIVKLITQHLDQKINGVNERIDNVLKVASENKNSIELAKHSEFIFQQLQDTTEKVEKIEKKTTEHETRIEALEDKVNDQKRQQRRQNLRLYRLREEEGENILKIVTDICRRVASQEDGRLVDVCHRVGPKKAGRTRPVIIKFLSRAERDAVWRNGKDSEFLKDRGLNFGEDLTSKDRETRIALWPRIDEARKRGQKAFFVGARAFINGNEVRLER